MQKPKPIIQPGRFRKLDGKKMQSVIKKLNKQLKGKRGNK